LCDDEHIALIDRSWLSEPIYASVYRPQEGSRIDSAQRRALERQAGHAVVVACLPKLQTCLDNFNARGDEEYLDDDQQLIQVYTRYSSLDKQTHLPVIWYDYQHDVPDTLLYKVLAMNQQVSYGKVLLVGEQANIRDGDHLGRRAPFTAYSRLGCSWWLNNKLDEAGIPERHLRWLNANTELGKPTNPADIDLLINRRAGAKIIALGRIAAKWCDEHNLGPDHMVAHPQHHKRFSYTKEYPLIPLLKEVLDGE
jgi:hypothetical protein